MSGSNAGGSSGGRWAAIWLWGTLAASAAIYQGYNLVIALGDDDTNHLESLLILILARQLREGPSTLYGPFSGSNPLVLIHAPLYYRLATLAAWPIGKLGCDPVRAAMIAGRGLSWIGMLGTAAATWKLSRVDGAPRRAAAWAALLVAAAPVFGSFPVTVRPDTVAIASQTLGVALAMGWLLAEKRRTGTLIAAYVAFGVGFWARQNFAISAIVTSAILAAEWLRGRARPFPIVAAHAVGVAVVLGYFAFEQAMTAGWMSRSVFGLTGDFRKFNYASWPQVWAVLFEAGKESIGLIALAAAVVVAAPGRPRGTRLDRWLWAYLVGESIAMVWLCLNSTGSWVNYAMPPVLYGSVLAARALDRTLEAGGPAWRLAPVAAAGLVLMAADLRYAAISARLRVAERSRLEALFDDPAFERHPPSTRYFVARPHYNRRFGRVELAHDDWLYSSYEAAGAVPPRSSWLREALTTGPVRLVIVAREPHRDPREVEGVHEPLTALGFLKEGAYGPYDIWERP